MSEVSHAGLKTRLMFIVVALAVGRPALAAGSPASSDAPLLASTPNQPLTFTIGDKAQVADVTRDGLVDANVSLRVSPGRLHGHVGADPVDLRLEPRRVAGTLGDQPVGLDVIRSGRTLEVAGTFGARSVAMDIAHDGVEAQIGPCDYHLRLSVERYRGFVTCGGGPASVDLIVPVALVARDDRELAAMLTALLAR